MTRPQIITLVIAIYFAVFLEVRADFTREWFGAPLSLLPALVVYAAIQYPVWGITLVAVCGGLWIDAFSATPLGVSVASMFALGFLLNRKKEILTHDHPIVRILLGLAVGTLYPLANYFLVSMISGGTSFNLTQIGSAAFCAIITAIVTPFAFRIFARLHRTFTFRSMRETSLVAKSLR
ncbi:MAG: rod shape-determining protein MreD [Verrucomicrobiales bacterium]|nr:rod shape-determining protein MreD [Verrucomicrobiales bacterium]|tara:strand:- start:372 stop:908 length:537 start_codon:yes stop_codon:yes gene_type:complete